MADAPDTAPYLLAFNDSAELANSRNITVNSTSGLYFQDFGPAGQFVFNTINALNAINNLSGTGILVGLNNVSPFFAVRQITADSTITVTNPTGGSGNIGLAVVAGQTVQQINFVDVSGAVGTGTNLKLLAGDGVTIASSWDSSSGGTATYTMSMTTPVDTDQWATYPAVSDVNMAGFLFSNVGEVIFANTTLPTPSSSNILSVTSGKLYFTNTTLGASRAIVTSATTNYAAVGSLLVGNGTDFSPLLIGTDGYILTMSGGTPTWVVSPAGGAPANATYITQTPNGSLTNEQALSLLATGLVKNTTSTGVLSIAAVSTTSVANDYVAGSALLAQIAALTPAAGSLIVGTSGAAFTGLAMGTANQVLAVNAGGTAIAWANPGGTGIILPVGSGSAPSLSFLSHSDVGAYYTGSGFGIASGVAGAALTNEFNTTGIDFRVNDSSQHAFQAYVFSSASGTAAAASFNFLTARGTVAAPVAIANNDIVGGIKVRGYESGTTYVGNSRMEFYATGAYTSSSTPTALRFYTTASGTTTAALAFTLTTSQTALFAGAVTAPALNLTTTPLAPTSGGTGFSIYADGDMIFASSTTTLNRLALGTEGQRLTVVSGAPAWATETGTGTVTSVGVSSSTGLTIGSTPITTSGTITVNLPGSGGAGAVVAGDVLVGGSGSYSALPKGSNNTVLATNGSGNVVWTAQGAGTVTSVAVSSSGSTITVTGSPITTSGTINVDIATVLIAKGGTGITSYTAGDTTYFASGTALSKLTIGAANTIMTSSGSAPQWVGGTAASANVLTYNGSAVVWAAPATAITTNGGTGLTSYTAGDTLYYASGTTLSKVAIGAAHTVMTSSGTAPVWVGGTASSGQVLTYNGTNVVWAAPATAGTVTSVGVSSTTGITVGSTPVTTSGTITVNLPGSGGAGAVVAGDLLLGSTGTYAGLAKGSANQVLTTNGSGNVVWAASGGTIAAGSVGAPSLNFTSDTTTGLYSGGASSGQTNFASLGVNSGSIGGSAITFQVASTTNGFAFTQAAGSAASPNTTMQMIGQRGTLASPTQIQTSDIIGRLKASGWNNASAAVGDAKIEFVAASAFTGSNAETQLDFYTVPNGATAAVKAVTIGSNKSLQISAGSGSAPSLSFLADPTTGIFGAASAFYLTFAGTTLIALTDTNHSYNLTSTALGYNFNQLSGGAASPNATIQLIGGRGTTTTPSAIQSGDIFGRYMASGYGAVSTIIGNSRIEFTATETFVASTNAGNSMKFYTVPNTTVTGVLALTLGQDQTATFAKSVTLSTGVLSLPNGTAGAPSYTFADTDTGMYYSTTNTLGLAAGGAAQLLLSATLATFTNPIVLPAGAVGAPALYMSTDTTTGIYRSGANEIAMAISGAQGWKLTSTGVTVAKSTTLTSGTLNIFQDNDAGASDYVSATLESSGSGQGGIIINAYNGSTAEIDTAFYNGTKGSPTAVASSDVIGLMKFKGYNGAALNEAARLFVTASENFSSGHAGCTVALQTCVTASSTLATRLTVNSAGQIGVGATAATHDFELVSSDDAAKTTTAVWATTSDIRIKKEIEDVEEALPTLAKVQPRKFKYTANHIKHLNAGRDDGDCGISEDQFYYGYVADELEKVIPSCVKVTNDRSGDNENLKIVNVHNLNVMLVKAVQELMARVEALEAKQG